MNSDEYGENEDSEIKDDPEVDSEEEEQGKGETSKTSKIIHSILAPIIYAPLLLLSLIYICASIIDKNMFLDKRIPFCKKNRWGVWKSYNISYKDYYTKINPWSFLNIVFKEDKSCSGGTNIFSYYLGKYYYNMVLLPSNRVHKIFQSIVSPKKDIIEELKNVTERQSPNYGAKNIFTNMAFFKHFLLIIPFVLIIVPILTLFGSLFYNFKSAISNIEGMGVLFLLLWALIFSTVHLLGHLGIYVYWLLFNYNDNVSKLMKVLINSKNWQYNFYWLFLAMIVLMEVYIWA